MRKTIILRRIISLALVVALLNTITLYASAASTYVGIDDDDEQGHDNSSTGIWSRVYSNNLRYGEGLITECTGSKEYKWIFGNPVYGNDKMGITLSVWLYHSSFNDPAAQYYVQVNNLLSYRLGVKNQNTAPAGWTDFSYFSWPRPGANPGNSARAIYLCPSSRGSAYTCGADWVEATIYY